MLKIKQIVFFVFFLVVPILGNAQQEKVSAALNYLTKGNIDSAKICIDLAVINPATSNNAEAWHVRGFIYKEIYKQQEKPNKQSPARLIALESIKKSIELDTEKKIYADNVQAVKFLISKLFNDAAESLDPVDYEVAVINFEKYKQFFPIVDPSPENLKLKEVEFNLAIATVYVQIYKSKKEKDEKYFNLTKNALNYVLSIDPNNISANYNMGTLYFNKGVDLINDSDYIDITAIEEIQESSLVLFKQSLPFMEKVIELEPTRKDALFSLAGIYFSLHEPEKSAEFQKKHDEIGK